MARLKKASSQQYSNAERQKINTGFRSLIEEILRRSMEYRKAQWSLLRKLNHTRDGSNVPNIPKLVRQQLVKAGFTRKEVDCLSPGEVLEELRARGDVERADKQQTSEVRAGPFGLMIDDDRRTAAREGKKKDLCSSPLDWHIFTVARRVAPEQFTMEQMKDGYPGDFSRGAYDTAQRHLNDSLKTIGLRISRRRLQPL
jgi:hypothetical protein